MFSAHYGTVVKLWGCVCVPGVQHLVRHWLPILRRWLPHACWWHGMVPCLLMLFSSLPVSCLASHYDSSQPL